MLSLLSFAESYLKFIHLQVHLFIVVNLLLELSQCGWILWYTLISSLLNFLLKARKTTSGLIILNLVVWQSIFAAAK